MQPSRGPLAPHPDLAGYFRDERERRTLVDHLFDASAAHYDAVIGAMSLGSGRWYRRDALKRAGLTAGMDVLDLATGTGIVARAAATLTSPERVTGLDPSQGMLEQARRTAPVRYVRGFAETLPFRDASFDFLSMGYALRHVADLGTTFGEALRVLRPGGRLLVLEISRARSRTGLAATRLYLGGVVPFLTGVLTALVLFALLRRFLDSPEHHPDTAVPKVEEVAASYGQVAAQYDHPAEANGDAAPAARRPDPQPGKR